MEREKGKTSDWIMDPVDCTFEKLISSSKDSSLAYKIAKLYFIYDQKSTELRMEMYEKIDKLISGPSE